MSTELIAAIIGGVIGAIGYPAIKFLTSKYRFEDPLRTYFCNNHELHMYDYGKIQHSFGEAKGKYWIHTNERISSGECTLYGPYSNDFNEPGNYKVVFNILAKGFDSDSAEVILLEVVRCVYTSRKEDVDIGHGNRVSTIILYNDFQSPISQKSISSSELSYNDSTVHGFELPLYVNGDAHYEYRAWVNKDKFSPEKHYIEFQTIQVYKVPQFGE
jgi:hypothetical protein